MLDEEIDDECPVNSLLSTIEKSSTITADKTKVGMDRLPDIFPSA